MRYINYVYITFTYSFLFFRSQCYSEFEHRYRSMGLPIKMSTNGAVRPPVRPVRVPKYGTEDLKYFPNLVENILSCVCC